MTLAEYRASRGITMEALAAGLGLRSKSYIHLIESTNRCSARVALAIEKHSGGLVDAASLNSDVAEARKQAA